MDVNMENKKELTIELSSYFILFFIAIIFRLVNLYLAPLSNSEALITLQAENLVRSAEILKIAPHQILLVNLLGLLFTIFGSQTFFVRLIPAFAGALLVFLPYSFRNQIGKTTALVLAVWLSFDPLFYLLSRKVDSTLLSVGFLLIAYILFQRQKWVGLGIIFALGVLTGIQFFIGVILLLLTSWLSKVNLFSKNTGEQVIPWKILLTAFISTLILVGTVFFIYPSQLGGAFSGLINLFYDISPEPVLPLMNLFTGLFFYEFIVLVLGFIGLLVYWKQNPIMGRFAGIWIGLALLFSVFYPARMISQLVWLILPLAYFAIWWILRVVNINSKNLKLTSLFSSVLFVFLVYIFMLIFSMNVSGFQLLGFSINSGVIGLIAIIIFIMAVVMIGWAWSWKITNQSLLLAICFGFVIFSVSAAWNLGGGRQPYHNELWHVGILSPDTDLMLNSINELSKINGIPNEEVQVYLQGIDSAAIIWALRDYDVRSLPVLPASLDTDVIITLYQNENQVYGPYRGQDYLLTSTPAWNLMTMGEWKNWILTRHAPQDGIHQQAIIVWFNNQWFVSDPVQN
jgi:hypothetical protein